MKDKFFRNGLIIICIACTALPIFSASNTVEELEKSEIVISEGLSQDCIQQTEDRLNEILELLQTKTDTLKRN